MNEVIREKMKLNTIVLAALFSVSSFGTFGAEVPHGQWSSSSKILKITSYWSYTTFKISGTDGCGGVGDGWWKLETQSSNATKDRALEYKKSMLLAAFSAGKNVLLRCENSAISDFTIEE